ncbi:hypothetical protein JS531_04130 [Bifidobacterium sp. CP2]|uniref:VG15 protein n=1 Tax=Bifidobacterium TaxID=1678 RepID=UPI001BDBCBF0|nr:MULTISPECIES: hypothetical protein [Bifidobacterium]MBT1181172.1 hypothetical protein [Bifidobacterium sp. CP2]MBW3079844.1 hypothetical protein [Bifidobacterium saguinibicoloris]
MANVERMVRAGGRETIGKAVRNDPHGVRYARIPNGPTCGFCIMLASRGYVYLSAAAAGADTEWHNGCNCEVSVSWDGGKPHIEGCDYEDLERRYLAYRGTIEDMLTEKRYRETYVDTFIPEFEDDEPVSFDKWAIRQIVAEMDTRDRQWLFDGKPVS